MLPNTPTNTLSCLLPTATHASVPCIGRQSASQNVLLSRAASQRHLRHPAQHGHGRIGRSPPRNSPTWVARDNVTPPDTPQLPPRSLTCRGGRREATAACGRQSARRTSIIISAHVGMITSGTQPEVLWQSPRRGRPHVRCVSDVTAAAETDNHEGCRFQKDLSSRASHTPLNSKGAHRLARKRKKSLRAR